MGSGAPTSSDRIRTNWTPTMERYFIDLMLDQMHRGNRLGHTFNKQAWTDMMTIFNAKFGCKYDRDTLKSHYTYLWKQYNDVKNLLEQNGFCWDDIRKLIVAPPHVWDAYIKVQPDAQVYRSRTLTNFEDLCLIYAYTQADGRYSRSSHDIDFDDDTQGMNFGVSGVFPPSGDERSKMDWTPAMDQYFIELMLDHLNLSKGNKSRKTFGKQAWTDMIGSFNAKFGSQFGKSFLRRRYRKLLKYYSDVQSILLHKGFSWDEKQQMVVADDLVWDNYIQAHPDAHAYRKKKMLNFQDLRLIYGKLSDHGVSIDMRQGRNSEPKILHAWAGEENKGLHHDRDEIVIKHWTPGMNHYLIDLLLNQALEGNKIVHVFTPEAWTQIVAMFNVKFGHHYDEDTLKFHAKHLRRLYNDIKILLELEGFSWDDSQEMVIAEDYIWDAYIKAHPNIQSYRNKSVPDYHKLCVIFGHESSGGRCSVAQDVYLENEDPDLIIGDDIQFLAGDACSKIDWTPLMERHLIDLLLDQVHRGNRINGALNTEVLMDMAVSFMETFGLYPDEEFLRNHHKSLEKQYCDMKSLLDQTVFSWDETHQMVTASEEVWDTYIKEYPDVESFRKKSKPNFYDLCLIFGNCIDKDWRSGQEPSCNGYGSIGNNGYCGRTDWMSSMDRYFIDLMLEQVRLGSMVDQKFNKLAWCDMVAKFSAEFGHQYNKDVLESRFMILRKQFNDMKNLLNHNGFAWNEIWQMIIADNNVWATYLKEHPDARSYRNRRLPSYNDLFLIYGNAIKSGWHLEKEICVDEEEQESPSSSNPTRMHGTGNVGIKLEIDNDPLDMGLNDIFGDLQSLAAEFEIPDQKKRRKTDTSSISASRKARRLRQDILHAIDVKPISAYNGFNNEEQYYHNSIESIVDALQAIPGMDDVLFLDASKLLEDEKNAQKFVAMDVNRRRKWLLRKLRQ